MSDKSILCVIILILTYLTSCHETINNNKACSKFINKIYQEEPIDSLLLNRANEKS